MAYQEEPEVEEVERWRKAQKGSHEFCLDNRPGALGPLFPSERYALWRKIKGAPAGHIRQETFQADSYDPHGTVMPFGADLGNPDRSLSLDTPLTPEQKKFAKEYDLPEHILQLRYMFHRFISISYACLNGIMPLGEFKNWLEESMSGWTKKEN